MQTYNFKEMVDTEGTVTLSGLPPLTQVAIVVIEPEISPRQKRLNKFIQDVSETHPFAKMSKEEILAHLRQTREEVYDELYGDHHVS